MRPFSHMTQKQPLELPVSLPPAPRIWITTTGETAQPRHKRKAATTQKQKTSRANRTSKTLSLDDAASSPRSWCRSDKSWRSRKKKKQYSHQYCNTRVLKEIQRADSWCEASWVRRGGARRAGGESRLLAQLVSTQNSHVISTMVWLDNLQIHVHNYRKTDVFTCIAGKIRYLGIYTGMCPARMLCLTQSQPAALQTLACRLGGVDSLRGRVRWSSSR